MAAELKGKELERFCFWIEYAISFPNQRQLATTEICRVINGRHLDKKNLKICVEFYRNLHPTTCRAICRGLFAHGILKEENGDKSYISPSLSKLLFETVTSSSIECAEYCANIWFERIQSSHQEQSEFTKNDFPNPIDFLQHEKTQASSISSAAVTPLNEQSNEQRKALMLECHELLNCVPSRFHISVIFGLFVLLEFYKSHKRPDIASYTSELEVWTDTWLHLVASSLLDKFKQPLCTFNSRQILLQGQPRGPSLHHVLCSLMISTNSVDLLKSFPSIGKKVVKGLEQLVSCSSGFTTTWLNIMKSYFE